MEIMCAGILDRGSEFFMTNPPDQTSRIYAACGPRALTSVVCSALDHRVGALDVYRLMRQHGLCDANGASAILELAQAGAFYGLKQSAFANYNEIAKAATISLAKQMISQYSDPCVLMLHNGQALKDAISGLGENAANLVNHFIALLGYNSGGASPYAGGKQLPEGFWVADGCNYAGGNDRSNPSGPFNAENVLQYYTVDNLLAAWPCALYAAQGYEVMAWHKQADGSATDDKGHRVGAGVATEIFAKGYEGCDGLMGETYFSGSGTDSFTPLTNGAVAHYNKVSGVDWDGASVAVDLWNTLGNVNEQLAAAQAEIAKLQGGESQAGPAEDAIRALQVALATIKVS